MREPVVARPGYARFVTVEGQAADPGDRALEHFDSGEVLALLQQAFGQCVQPGGVIRAPFDRLAQPGLGLLEWNAESPEDLERAPERRFGFQEIAARGGKFSSEVCS